MAKLWSEVLDVEVAGANDNFFALGGHSLLAARVVSRLNGQAGVDLTMRAIFEAPTVSALAASIDSETCGRGVEARRPYAQAPRSDAAPPERVVARCASE